MHVESYCSKNLCVPGGLQAIKMVSDPLCSKERTSAAQDIKNYGSTDEGMLGTSPDCNFYLIYLFPQF